MKPRKVPQRLCVGCMEMKPKKELIRIVRTPEGEVLLDSTGKKAGRGVYLCVNKECLTKALKGHKLEKGLQQPLSEEVLERLKVGLGYENS
ncbi:MAG TPA: YlxR family protein [Peptococcaceae bacterium]|nr:YlxR family protein [Clostridia bacterium]HOB81907.1 YlxR family protein [Peptococcaceae bacterium]HPZ71898.1 YlxR family protein [Peptococcaceae bacterium]HQD53875.1 YlxR family protein [Peptococcaceae bacterium]